MSLLSGTESLWTLASLALVLGIKHGFDADHLAAIDGLTRFNARSQPVLARRAGALFSLGHGAVVLGVALTVSTVASAWQAPLWLEATGAWFSIAVLALLGWVNLRQLWRMPADAPAVPWGWRSRWWGACLRAGHPLSVAGVGALFAVSFDTVSQAALFAVVALHFQGWLTALMLAGLFVLGMLISDCLNGLWIARLLRRADQAARISSRVMTGAVAALSLLTAAVGVCKLASPAFSEWMDARTGALSLLILLTLACSFALGEWLARRAQASASAASASAYGSSLPTDTKQVSP